MPRLTKFRTTTSEYPSLAIACGSGTFLVAVTTQNFVTASGAVAYSFDNGPIFSDFWIESSDFSTLGYPALSNLAQKNFAGLIAASSKFGFAFNEFQAGAHATIFRVTGLNTKIGTILSACPSNALRADAAEAGVGSLFGSMSALRSPTPMDAQRELRSASGASEGTSPAAALTSVRTPEQVLLSVP
jgi:hypothetical protein